MIPIDKITIRDRGPTPRGMRKAYGIASKAAWEATGKYFHDNFRDRRFSQRHGREAGYDRRGGEEPGISQQAFLASYTYRKQKKHGHRRPLEFSGETRRRVKAARIVPSRNGVRVTYAGARTFNYRRSPKSPKMTEEFTKLLPDEVRQLADVYDSDLDDGLAADQSTTTKQV